MLVLFSMTMKCSMNIAQGRGDKVMTKTQECDNTVYTINSKQSSVKYIKCKRIPEIFESPNGQIWCMGPVDVLLAFLGSWQHSSNIRPEPYQITVGSCVF